jgi:uncharacterized protein YbjQ (UPF0145 family)
MKTADKIFKACLANALDKMPAPKVMITTTDSLTGYEVKKNLGVVWGSSVKSKHLGHDIAAFFKSIVGGELDAYRHLLNEARHDAIHSLVLSAEKMGANAVVGITLGSSHIMPTIAEVFAYGTAVIVEKKR